MTPFDLKIQIPTNRLNLRFFFPAVIIIVFSNLRPKL